MAPAAIPLTDHLDRLTRRELEVAVLVRDGMTDREIADRLRIGRRTAEWHVEQILNKLGLRSRGQIAVAVARAEPGLSANGDGRRRPGLARWPPQPHRMFGREAEVLQLRELILRPDVRLVTVTGPPGTGKTTLSTRLCAQITSEFEDGAIFVDLSAITDPSLVVAGMGHALNGPTTLQGLCGELGERDLLLMIDNFEQVVEAATHIAELLASCPNLKVLATSREPLHLLHWEHEFHLGPLPLPEISQLPEIGTLSTVPSIALFVERATARNPQFALNPVNAPSVAAICVRLDGLPLAIELVAAEMKALSPDVVLRRLTEGLAVGSHGGADFPARHRTLDAAIRASYDLLPDLEQALFRRLGAFVGGFDLDALEVVCSDPDLPPGHAVQLLTRLIDRSLVQRELDGTRFRLLETIREFAVDRLRASGDITHIEALHTGYFLDLALQDHAVRRTAREFALFDRLSADVPNLRAVLQRALRDGDLVTGMRLCGALTGFWPPRGLWGEGRQTLTRFVEKAEENGDIEKFSFALLDLAALTFPLDAYPETQARLERFLATARSSGDHRGVANALMLLGLSHLDRRNLRESRRLLEEALPEARTAGWIPLVTDVLRCLGLLFHFENDDAEGARFMDESLRLARESEDYGGTTLALWWGGEVDFSLRAYASATSKWEEALRLWWSMHGRPNIDLLEAFAKIAAVLNDSSAALRLAGAADARRGRTGGPAIRLFFRAGFEERMNEVAGGDARRHADWLAGRRMSAGEAVDLAFNVADRVTR